MSRVLVLVAVSAAAFASASAFGQRVSPRDVVFERWVRDTFFGGYKSSYATQRWDVPASVNRDHGNVPVSIRTAPLGEAVDLGEALRQYEIDESFLMIIGFWQQAGDGLRGVNIVAAMISAQQWRSLWGPITYADLQRLEAVIRDPAPTVEETRRRALVMKNAPPFNQAIIQVNPKIDDRGSRRLLCSLRFTDVFKHLAPGADAQPQEKPTLFGVAYPGATGPKSP